ncbi:outer membrane lipoprotein-sorting protein [Chitinimonas lacunae]|uniref:Outer membrane lipoprotein-sorting protein n=1 Tax=Chitinimonas lacunae TaxID=1963018 RepID=A0ABV8MLB8_9NEIS
MRNLSLLLLALFAGFAQAMPTSQQFLTALDATAGQSGGSEKSLRLARIDNGVERDSRNFKVLDNGKGASLVEFLDPAERGQKVLSTQTEMWFLGGGSRRAIKVPPISRLFGDASLGDIARLNLAQDYQIAATAAEGEGREASWRLNLDARSEAATYSKVTIWLRQSDLEPLRAHYFLASGKHGKSAEFVRNRRVGAAWSSEEWLLAEPGENQRRTRLTIEAVRAKEVPDAWFTPRYLEMQR